MSAADDACRVRALLADIGGTNARLALLYDNGRLVPLPTRAVADYDGPGSAIAAALAEAGASPPSLAVLAVAGPVHRRPVRLTNAAWCFDRAQLIDETGIGTVQLVNDFAAQAWALPALGPDDTVALGQAGDGLAGAPRLVLGPGTGLGVATFVPGSEGANERVLAGEGGHAGLAAEDARDAALLARLRSRFGRVSAERVLSGPGLAALAQAVAAEDALTAPPEEPAALVDAARAGDGAAQETLARFLGFLGSYAGDLALVVGAWGGVYLAGGIPPRLRPELESGGFRARFEAKGRFREALRAVPTRLILRRDPAFLGLAELARRLA